MLRAVRRGDFVVSVCPFVPSGPFITASNTSFVDGRGQVRVADKAIPGICITGSKSTFVDGRPAATIISKVICGKIVTASNNVFIG
jgi:uncharacterized Zn-binding protein involved in type VI secretion